MTGPRLTASTDTSTSALANAVLQDYGLAQKLPRLVNQKSVGLFYIDGDDAGARLLSPPALNSLKVLRTQAVLAIMRVRCGSSARKR